MRKEEKQMTIHYCPNCNANIGFKRSLGFGTFFMVVITGFIWLLAIPLYPERCIKCGGTEKESQKKIRSIDNGMWAK